MMTNKCCTNFKPVEQVFLNNKNSLPNCSACVYFSSRNCGMDAANSVDPLVDFFG